MLKVSHLEKEGEKTETFQFSPEGCEWLRVSKTGAVQTGLRQRMQDPTPETRIHAFEELQERRVRGQLDARQEAELQRVLLDAVLLDADPSVRASATWTLTDSAPSGGSSSFSWSTEGMKALEGALERPSAQERLRAAQALRRLGRNQSVYSARLEKAARTDEDRRELAVERVVVVQARVEAHLGSDEDFVGLAWELFDYRIHEEEAAFTRVRPGSHPTHRDSVLSWVFPRHAS